MKVLLLSGPAGCGKDTVAEALFSQYDDGCWPSTIETEKFAKPLRAALCGLFGWTDEYLEAQKRSIPEVRRLMIGLSETLVKPELGEAWFGLACADRIAGLRSRRAGEPSLVVISDCGFDYECRAFMDRIRMLTPEGVEFQLWRIHRPGHDFSGDSRTYVELEGVPTLDIHNDGTRSELILQTNAQALEFFG